MTKSSHYFLQNWIINHIWVKLASFNARTRQEGVTEGTVIPDETEESFNFTKDHHLRN